ncbi:MAG: hypothetical protein C7B45_13665 [Sulfobacillus acidophilus]|uniref:LysM domain-containing protein n=1 Tax=Sulfobacillus acidophilus TaxID=53633 RepID=A0A2T2WER2_9FIRM|nr:MAG: hypothetical protein C7B45_13665 [Sulfobacillus acidophilus]
MVEQRIQLSNRYVAWTEWLVGLVLALWMAWGAPPHTSRPYSATAPVSGVLGSAHARRRTAGPEVPALFTSNRLHTAHLADARIYEVHWGDTLWSIAQHFHVSVPALVQANHLHNRVVFAGTTLRIPEHSVLARQMGTLGRQTQTAHNLLARQLHEPHPYHLSVADMRLLARLVQAEAGNQSYVAQVAVAAVVLNRVRTAGFPHTITGVIFAPGQFEAISSPAFQKPPTRIAMIAVRAAEAGWDPSGGALYFYNPHLAHVVWMNSLPKLAHIDSQIFCR